MPIIMILAVLAVAGVLLWAISAWPNLDPTIKQIMRIVVIVFVCLWLISLFVPLSMPVGRWR